jgi:peptidoglycan/LPS O-acetylase OafA/YrhL
MAALSRKNNFDHIRLLLALAVFFFHIGELTQMQEFHLLRSAMSASVAVHSFFIVSGFLIFMSYDRSRSLRSYFSKRLRRIAPGYVAVIALSFLFLSLLSSLPASAYFSSGESLRYLLANLTTLNFLHPTLPGVFTDHPYRSVNGALWTIKIEVLFYLTVPLIAMLFRRFEPWKVLGTLFILSALYYFAMGWLYTQTGHPLALTLQRQLPGQMMFFSGGALLYYYFDYFKRYALPLFFAAILGYILQHLVDTELLYPLYALSLSIIVIYFALMIPWLGHIARYGDLSYGIYIWHFPIIQSFISWQLFDTHPWLAVGGLLGVVLLLAWLSWHLIEKPFLGKTSHYVQESEKA